MPENEKSRGERKKYYQPTLKRSLLDSINILFKNEEKIMRFYDNNPVAFVEDAIRRLIIYYEEKTD